MTHSHNCDTTGQFFTGTLGSEEHTGPAEYRIDISKDVISCDDDIAEVYYSAEMTIGRRWGDHLTVFFHDELSDDKTRLLYGMRQMIEDLKDAVTFLESL